VECVPVDGYKKTYSWIYWFVHLYIHRQYDKSYALTLSSGRRIVLSHPNRRIFERSRVSKRLLFFFHLGKHESVACKGSPHLSTHTDFCLCRGHCRSCGTYDDPGRGSRAHYIRWAYTNCGVVVPIDVRYGQLVDGLLLLYAV
jgi:hypothetical protein